MGAQLFSGNIIAGFVITVIAIVSYSHLKEEQQMCLIYLTTFALAAFKIARIWVCFCLLAVSMYLFIEFLTRDEKKLLLYTSFKCKLLDYLYSVTVKYNMPLFALSLVFMFHFHIIAGWFRYVLIVASAITLVLCEHYVVVQYFEVKTVSELMIPFEINPYYTFNFSKEAAERYKLLCEFEDKTYLRRTSSYSFASKEYFKLSGLGRQMKQFFQCALLFIKSKDKKEKIRNLRGHSTPEMQLIRTIGVIKGYDKHKFLRKIYEIIYSYTFFHSLEKYVKDNSGLYVDHFREYILDIYLKNVITKINGHRIDHVCDVFKNPDDVSSWPMEAMFVVSLGLGFRYINDYHLNVYGNIVEKYDLNKDLIYKYRDMIMNGEKIPCKETGRHLPITSENSIKINSQALNLLCKKRWH